MFLYEIGIEIILMENKQNKTMEVPKVNDQSQVRPLLFIRLKSST